MEALQKESMLKALTSLDCKLDQKIELIIGGGGAMVLAHSFPLSTYDIDAVPKGGGTLSHLSEAIESVARELNLPLDWLNPWFGQFAHNLPSDFNSRLIEVFNGKNIEAQALGKDDMLIMKCFASRAKDVPHAKVLIKAGADVDFVGKHIESLMDKGIPQAKKAIDFLDDLLE